MSDAFVPPLSQCMLDEAEVAVHVDIAERPIHTLHSQKSEFCFNICKHLVIDIIILRQLKIWLRFKEGVLEKYMVWYSVTLLTCMNDVI